MKKDDIELPPLPLTSFHARRPYETEFTPNYSVGHMRQYARAAIKADRQRIADQLHKDGFYDGVILGLQAMAACGNAFNADYVELLRSAGVHETVKRAMKEGLYELAGLDCNASEDLRKEIDSTRKELTQKIIYGSTQSEHT